MSEPIAFFAVVTVSVRLRRVRERKYSALLGQIAAFHVWREYNVSPPTAAIYLGTRTLRNGVLLREYEGGHVFQFHREGPVVRAALVCFGPRSNPCYVPLEAVSLPALEEEATT